MTASPPPTARFLAVAAGLPALFTVIAVVAQLILLPRLPDPAATHWGFNGLPDSFGPRWIGPLLAGLLGAGLPALVVANALPGLRRGDGGGAYRLSGALAPAISLFICVLMILTTVAQLDLATARESRLAPAWVLVPFAAALAVGVASWFALPREAGSAPGSTVSPRPLTSSERVVWTGRATLSPIGLVLIGLLVAGSWATVFLTAPEQTWMAVGVAVLVLVATLTTMTFRVRVDGRGLSVVSVFGLPRFRVPLADIASVEVVPVRPLGQFGGWGLRRIPGAFGVVLRTGDALQITRRSGPRFLVTVADAPTAASLLQGLATRAARTP
ncbi:uncharacterized protein DUF1648 [Actinocorallia herbida]|uniref:Uncharacterized protein DUF1648 n=1 Tax=Actinocorallia herbida TaxID=58109 RepID=A0A3N1CW90_9ACTN|nr:DUF1648 domain-containing protein [Actinocorallia herbida]ROO85553.1 uncharacterized protein DUF1648 [Actinocorallia herbida]